MSIEMDNTQTALEKVDAAWNLVEQMHMAHRMSDEVQFKEAHQKATTLLSEVVGELQQGEKISPCPPTKSAREIISKINIIGGNLEHIAKTGKINGSLLISIEEAMQEYANQCPPVLTDNDMEKLLTDFMAWVDDDNLNPSEQEYHLTIDLRVRGYLDHLRKITKEKS